MRDRPGKAVRPLITPQQFGVVVVSLFAFFTVCCTFAEPAHEETNAGLIAFRYESHAGCDALVDKHTQLMWQRCSLGQKWNGSTCIGSPLRMEWDHAASHRDDRCGFSDWHLPQLSELESLLTEGVMPAIDLEAFPNTPAGSFWTWAESKNDPRQAWYVNFGRGATHQVFKDSRFHVRLVREKLPPPNDAKTASR